MRWRARERSAPTRPPPPPNGAPQGRETTRALGHLLAGGIRKNLRVQPHTCKLLSVGRFRLGDLVLVVREQQVDAATVDVERLAEKVLAHRRALDVPAGASGPKRRVPGRPQLVVARLRPFPQSEVARRLLLIFVLDHSRAGAQAAAVEVRQGPVATEAIDAEIHVAIGEVRISPLDE